MVKLDEEITDTTRVHQTNSYMRLQKANELKVKLLQSSVRIKVNDMEFDTLMKIPFK